MNNNNDLDSLLNEFQSLSKNETEPMVNNEELKVVPSSTDPVSVSVQAVAPQPAMPTEQVAVQPTVTPVQAVAPQPAMPTEQVAVQPSVTPVQAVAPQPAMPTEQVAVQPSVTLVQAVAPQPVMPTEQVAVQPQPVMPTEQVAVQPTEIESSLTIDAVSKIEEEKKETLESKPEEVTGGSNNKSNDKKSNTGMIFMIILFILFAAAIFLMPRIINYNGDLPGKVDPNAVVPEENTEEDNSDVVDDNDEKESDSTTSVTTLTCTAVTSEATLENPMTTNISRIFTFEEDKLITDKEIKIVTYNADIFIDPLKSETELACVNHSNKFAGATGYSSECVINNNVVTTTTAIDYATFTNPTTLTLDGISTTLSSAVNANDSLESVKSVMEVNGVTCK